MTLNLIPALKGTGRRRAVDKVAELEAENRSLFARQMAADDFFARLIQDRDDVYAAWAWAEQRRQEAEVVASCVMSERDELADEVQRLRHELAPYRAAEANATRVTVPRMVRDTSAIEDQATQPIPVLTLQQAHGIGPVTDPGRIS